ncbi:gas vesicle protein GvpJ [Portibacter marinus]|uniref:gas vesicle protein GvpJ n=1 Tax=Portibacter marinus TaxID=2898660 RepID=UPI001F41E65D|nr:gas vesicle protein GvpJ [Portibacter marinus]
MSIKVTNSASDTEVNGIGNILERILDKGIVIVGDIALELVGVELITIRLRLLIASTERAEELGIDWWRNDPFLSSKAKKNQEERQLLRDTLQIALDPDDDVKVNEENVADHIRPGTDE